MKTTETVENVMKEATETAKDEGKGDKDVLMVRPFLHYNSVTPLLIPLYMTPHTTISFRTLNRLPLIYPLKQKNA